MGDPVSPAPVKGGGRRELPAYLSNGVIGLRVRENPLATGMALLNGYSGMHPVKKIEAAAVAPYPLAGNISLNGVWLSDVPHQITVLDQAYNFANGELSTRLRYVAEGVRASIEVLTFCCRHQPTLLAQEISVTVDKACDLKFQAIADIGSIPGKMLARTLETPGGGNDFDGSLLWEADGGFSRCGLALVTELLGDNAPNCETPSGGDRSPLIKEYGLRAKSSRTYRLRQIASLVPSALHDHPDRHAERLVALGRHQGFEGLRKANGSEWKELWKGRVILHGASREWQQLADAAFYYMNASVHAGSPSSTSMFGLATWHDYHYYYGHVMWDIETFSIPPLMLLQPEAAEALLEFRTRNLLGARRTAQAMGRRGLQFPWEAAPGSGQEAAPSPGTAAWHEDHVSLDVALAFANYAWVSGDRNFLREKAWPVLYGVSDWIASRSHRGRRGWEIRRSMGIAERKSESDNEAFTLLATQAVLEATMRAAESLGHSINTDWQQIAGHLKLPVRNGVLVSHDAFRRNEEKAATPSPLMGIFPLDVLDAQVGNATLDYYLPMSPDYVGSPMLSAFYGVWAARQGDRRAALKLLDEGYAKFVTGRFLQTLEYRPDKFPEQPKAGPFFANMGGFLMSLLLGFPRLKISDKPVDDWPQDQVILPAGWESIEVERLWIRGQPARMLARQGQKTQLFHS
jgi:trehalose/maltose hydrolase-like predicted phosphorylase